MDDGEEEKMMIKKTNCFIYMFKKFYAKLRKIDRFSHAENMR